MAENPDLARAVIKRSIDRIIKTVSFSDGSFKTLLELSLAALAGTSEEVRGNIAGAAVALAACLVTAGQFEALGNKVYAQLKKQDPREANEDAHP